MVSITEKQAGDIRESLRQFVHKANFLASAELVERTTYREEDAWVLQVVVNDGFDSPQACAAVSEAISTLHNVQLVCLGAELARS